MELLQHHSSPRQPKVSEARPSVAVRLNLHSPELQLVSDRTCGLPLSPVAPFPTTVLSLLRHAHNCERRACHLTFRPPNENPVPEKDAGIQSCESPDPLTPVPLADAVG